MIVADLNVSNDLDQAALSAVAGGGGIVAREIVGTSRQHTSWQYHGERALAFLGNVYVYGKGWTRKYRSVKTWSRTEIFKAYYNILVWLTEQEEPPVDTENDDPQESA